MDNKINKTKEEFETLEWFRNFHNALLSTVFLTEKLVLNDECDSRIIQTDPEYKEFDRLECLSHRYLAMSVAFESIYKKLFPVPEITSEHHKQMIKEADHDFVERHRDRLDVRTVPDGPESSETKLVRLVELIEYCKTILEQLSTCYQSGNIDGCWMNYARLRVLNY